MKATISATISEGLTVRTLEGGHATLAIIHQDGKLLEAGPHICKAAFETSIAAHRRFWIGLGHFRPYNREEFEAPIAQRLTDPGRRE